jgi:hypothetical protein
MLEIMGFCCFLVILYGFVAKLVICRVINCVVQSVSLCFHGYFFRVSEVSCFLGFGQVAILFWFL